MELPDVGVTWVISVFATVLLLTYFWFSRPNPKYPPCPLRPWPIVGNLLQLNKDPREQLARFRRQCGDIYSLRLGSNNVIIINAFDVLKEAFIKQGDDFSDKSTIYIDIVTDGFNKGIVSANGASWKENRTFTTSVLKDFGLGKNIFANKIQEEVSLFMDLLESFRGESTNIQPFTTLSVSNVMCSILVGHRYEYDDNEFLRILKMISECMSKIEGTALLNYFPWLRFLPGDLFSCKYIVNTYFEICHFFIDYNMKQNENVIGEPGNFIAAYLQEINSKKMTGEKTTMDKPNLIRVILDLFIAGTDTISNTIGWIFLYMVNYPDVQEKIFQEINEVVGLERTPVMQDQAKLIYLTATIMEVQRLVNVVFLSTPRVASRDVNLRGYFIPKGTQILVNFNTIHHDPCLWGDDADTFRPERFISEDGILIKPEILCLFSLGKRSCLGKSLAMIETFLFVSNILQRFQILAADPTRIPPMEGHFGITHTPLPCNIRLVSRRSRL